MKSSIIFTFTFFYRKRKRCDIIENEDGIGITVISKTKIYDREYIDNDRNPTKAVKRTRPLAQIHKSQSEKNHRKENILSTRAK